MGNLIQRTESNYLLGPVSSQLESLTKCNNHTGTSNNILKIQHKIAKMDLLHGIYVEAHQLRTIFRQTQLEGSEAIILNYFIDKSTKKVNMKKQ